jgi:biotin carboxylase
VSWLVFVESNTTGTGRLFARRAAELGLAPVVLTREPSRYPYLALDGIAHRVVDSGDLDALERELESLAREQPIAGVLTSSEYFVATAARLARRRGLPGADAEALEGCRDKRRQREILAAHSVGGPCFRRVDGRDDIDGAIAAVGLPAVVKPAHGSGSVDVRWCDSAEAVTRHCQRILGQGQNERGLSLGRGALVESVLPGEELSVETFDLTVVGITRKHLGPLPAFVEIGHDFPAALDRGVEARAAATAIAALRALGLGFGPAHVELRVTVDAAAIVEVNPRLAGGMIPEMVRCATGIDLIAATIRRATGGTPALTPTRGDHASIRFVVARHDGVVRAVSGLEAARALPFVAEANVSVAVGAHVALGGDFRDRLGYVIACAPDGAAAAADRARDLIRVDVDLATTVEESRA